MSFYPAVDECVFSFAPAIYGVYIFVFLGYLGLRRSELSGASKTKQQFVTGCVGALRTRAKFQGLISKTASTFGLSYGKYV